MSRSVSVVVGNSQTSRIDGRENSATASFTAAAAKGQVSRIDGKRTSATEIATKTVENG